MSILIKGMEIPKTCIDCKLTYCDDDFGRSCVFTDVPCLNLGRQNECPLVEIPTPHGDLIDKNKVIEEWSKCPSDSELVKRGMLPEAIVLGHQLAELVRENINEAEVVIKKEVANDSE